VTDYLEKKYEKAWICVIGKKFTANINTEAGYFFWGNTE
jgi:hypothetical protein